MKPPELTWEDYFDQVMDFLEGTSPHDQRSFSQAAAIFEEIAREAQEDPDLQAEAYFRRAQTAHYQRKTDEAVEWVNKGKAVLNKSMPLETQAQCALLEGIILEDQGNAHQAMVLYEGWWGRLEAADVLAPKLQGDIANRAARISMDYPLINEEKNPAAARRIRSDAACRWILRAEECFTEATSDEKVFHAFASVKARAALYLIHRANVLWQEADQLYRQGKVKDPYLRTAFWLHRCKAAWKQCQPLRAAWFAVRCAISYLSCRSN